MTVAFLVRLEGWRFMPHSYSLVFCHHAAEIARRSDLAPSMVDLTPPRWDGKLALPWPEDEKLIRAIPAAMPDFYSEDQAVYRCSVPVDLDDTVARNLTVHITADSGAIQDGMMAGNRSFKDWIAKTSAHLVTPSAWSREGLIRAGADPARVHIVPHGVDARLFKPGTPEERLAERTKLGIDDRFVFLSVGSMARRKGIDLLVAAFRDIWREHPEALLLLKGTDGIARAKPKLDMWIRKATAGQAPREQEWTRSIRYLGDTMSTYQLAQLYKAADCYVTPYRAEAFNLPALQAVAAGLPLIATAGGPTDDFTPIVGRTIDATKGPDTEVPGGECLEPDLDALMEKMGESIANDRQNVGASGALLDGAVEPWSWPAATDKLLEVLRR